MIFSEKNQNFCYPRGPPPPLRNWDGQFFSDKENPDWRRPRKSCWPKYAKISVAVALVMVVVGVGPVWESFTAAAPVDQSNDILASV